MSNQHGTGKTPLIEGEDYYWNEQGLVTFTEAYHRKRGYCCGNGCRHCPYDYEAVPEPRRTHLLSQREGHNPDELPEI